MHGKVCFLREYIKKDVKMLRRVKIMLHVIREENYWLLIIIYDRLGVSLHRFLSCIYLEYLG